MFQRIDERKCECKNNVVFCKGVRIRKGNEGEKCNRVGKYNGFCNFHKKQNMADKEYKLIKLKSELLRIVKNIDEFIEIEF